jgi:hypothetical protein
MFSVLMIHGQSIVLVTVLKSELSLSSRTKEVVVDATWHRAQRMNGEDTATTSTMHAGQIFQF